MFLECLFQSTLWSCHGKRWQTLNAKSWHANNMNSNCHDRIIQNSSGNFVPREVLPAVFQTNKTYSTYCAIYKQLNNTFHSTNKLQKLIKSAKLFFCHSHVDAETILKIFIAFFIPLRIRYDLYLKFFRTNTVSYC